jgi:hypothetical protein
LTASEEFSGNNVRYLALGGIANDRLRRRAFGGHRSRIAGRSAGTARSSVEETTRVAVCFAPDFFL